MSKAESSYFLKLAKMMVLEDKDLFQASVELKLGLTESEAEALYHNPQFQTILRTERLKFFESVANDPNRTKNAHIGQLAVCVEKLMADGQNDKAANVILQIGKMEGWIGSDTSVTVVGNLNQQEIADLKQKLQSQINESGGELPETQGNA